MLNPDCAPAVAALPPLRQVIAALKLSAQKSFGQNFLLDINLTRKIARQIPDLSKLNILEVGPGPGGLTRALLLEGAQQILAIEFDKRCIEALQPLLQAAEGRLTVLEGDALAENFLLQLPAPRAVVANLPYHIATPLLLGWLKQCENWHYLALMFQAEMAERLVAEPNSKAYGRLSVLAQLLTDAKIVLRLPSGAFTPPPKVNSAVVLFQPKAQRPDALIISKLEKITAAAFGQRRKMLRSSLADFFTEEQLHSHGINPTQRAETVTPQQFLMLAVASGG